ncbi:MAG: HNH endonuclease [Aequoribacter sp.]|uniref:HNH endonuclease n=1 Tax=Aequoribacter sp. TaxID=2847771 RepID=UPI003C342C69
MTTLPANCFQLNSAASIVSPSSVDRVSNPEYQDHSVTFKTPFEAGKHFNFPLPLQSNVIWEFRLSHPFRVPSLSRSGCTLSLLAPCRLRRGFQVNQKEFKDRILVGIILSMRKGQILRCPVCDTEFYRYPSQIKKGWSITCSRQCRAKHLQETGETRNCIACEKPFYARQSQIKQGYATTCSKSCFASLYKNGTDLSCKQCGKAFYRNRTQIAQGESSYCSWECKKQGSRLNRKRGRLEMFTNWQKREWKDDQCAQCDSKEFLELDHIVPRFAGGKAERANAQTLCKTCNREKFHLVDKPKYTQKR